MKKTAVLLMILSLIFLSAQTEVLPAGMMEIPDGNKYLSITFDDGPRAETTGMLLEGLACRGVQATFFLVGEQIEGNEPLIRRMALDGHQIGSHTYNHVMLAGATEEEVADQIRRTEEKLKRVLEKNSAWWLRPPYGLITEKEAAWIQTPMIQWSIDPEDWKYKNAEQIAAHILATAKSGDIILLHDIYPTSVEAALTVIDRMQEEGYCFVTVEELFLLRGVVPEAGRLYMKPEAPVWRK